MTLIPNFQEFEETNPLNGKITPALAESLAEYFANQEGINEAGVLDSIKNTLSNINLLQIIIIIRRRIAQRISN